MNKQPVQSLVLSTRLRSASLTLNPLVLPSAPWRAPDELPYQPGCYLVLLDVQLKPGVALPSRVPYVSSDVLRRLAGGRRVALVLYVGMSNCLHERWTARPRHHKAQCVEVMTALLSRWFDVGNLRIAYVGSSDKGKASAKAAKLEAYLIRQFKPLLNGLAPISRKKRRPIRSTIGRCEAHRRAIA